MLQEGVSRPIKRWSRDNISAVIGDIGEGVIERGLPGGDTERPDSALELRDALLQHRVGWIGDTAVAIALGFEIE